MSRVQLGATSAYDQHQQGEGEEEERERTPPRLPPRRSETLDPDATPDDPPPAYEATPHNGDRPLDYGPTRPFQPPPHAPPQLQQYPTGGYAQPQHPPPPTLPPPGFPFWNGPNLTPQQTGFSEGYHHSPPPPPPQNGAYYYPSPSPLSPVHSGGYPSSPSLSPQPFHPPPGPPPPPPPRPSASTSPNPSSSAPHPPPPPTYAPTTTPTPGQPLLRGGKLLVYPPGHVCQKCGNTGYKFNDPSHPCRKDWDKYGKLYTGALRLAPNAGAPGSNFQRPLRSFVAPQQAPPSSPAPLGGGRPGLYPPPQGPMYQQPPMPGGYPMGPYPVGGPGWPPANVAITNHPPPGALVLRPGDPRIGGQLCRECGGRGLVPQLFSFFGDEETCWRCRGAGRVFS